MVTNLKMHESASREAQFDFCDFGCSKGDSITFGLRALGGKRGIGIDLSPQKAALALSAGYDVVIGDISHSQILASKSVRFTIISHLLEHLPTMDQARSVLKNALRISQDYVLIIGPYFDADDFLRAHGLKFYWSDWSGHKLHLEVAQLISLFGELEVSNYEIYGLQKVRDSFDKSLHPLSSPRDQHDWDAEVHDAKSLIEFGRDIYRQFVCIAWITNLNSLKITEKFSDIYPINTFTKPEGER